MDAAAAFLAAQGLGPDGDARRKTIRKKKERRKQAVLTPKAEKVRILVCVDGCTLATRMFGTAMVGNRLLGPPSRLNLNCSLS
jgi:hypothetical protein